MALEAAGGLHSDEARMQNRNLTSTAGIEGEHFKQPAGTVRHGGSSSSVLDEPKLGPKIEKKASALLRSFKSMLVFRAKP